jgi:hypothetical protein
MVLYEPDKDNKKNKFQLHKMRERQKRKKKHSPYYAPTGLELFGTMIKEQNKELLLKIANDMKMNQDNIDTMFRLFWIPNYWLPTVTANAKKENDNI